MKLQIRGLALPVLLSATTFLGASFALAMPPGTDPAGMSGASLVHQAAVNGVNGGNVVEISYPGGTISMQGYRWTEHNANGSFEFEETGRDDWSVYLVDRSRDVWLQLDLHRMLVLYATGNDPMQTLYRIDNAFRDKPDHGGKQRSDDRVYRFTCTEGVPLVARIRSRGERSTAFVSIDGGPEVRLRQTESGSGARYSDGGISLSMKGGTAYVDWGGTRDTCRK